MTERTGRDVLRRSRLRAEGHEGMHKGGTA